MAGRTTVHAAAAARFRRLCPAILCAIAGHLSVADICNLRTAYGTAAVPMLSLVCALDKIRTANPELAEGAPGSDERELADFIALFVCSDTKLSDYYLRQVLSDSGVDYDNSFLDCDSDDSPAPDILGHDGGTGGHHVHGLVGQGSDEVYDYDEQYESDEDTALSADAIADATSQWVPVPEMSPLEGELAELGPLAELVRINQNEPDCESECADGLDFAEKQNPDEEGLLTESGLFDGFIDSVQQALNDLEEASNAAGFDLGFAEDHAELDDLESAREAEEFEHHSVGDSAGPESDADANDAVESSGNGNDADSDPQNDSYSDGSGIGDEPDFDDLGDDDGDFDGFDDWDSGDDGVWDE